MAPGEKAVVRAAREFALAKNGGIPYRIRERLEAVKPGLAVLVNERLNVTDIQEFVRLQTGMKVTLKVMQQYCREAFNYPAEKA